MINSNIEKASVFISLLQELSQDSLRFYSILGQSFGSAFNTTVAETIRTQWANGDFSQLPAIRVLDGGMEGILGAYAKSTNTIYLSQTLIDAGQETTLIRVLLEETGHFLDAHLNNSDTPGDEGYLFSALVRGETLSADQIAVIQAEDDTGSVMVDEQAVSVEMAVSIFNSDFKMTISDSKNGGLFFIKSGVEGAGVVVQDNNIAVQLHVDNLQDMLYYQSILRTYYPQINYTIDSEIPDFLVITLFLSSTNLPGYKGIRVRNEYEVIYNFFLSEFESLSTQLEFSSRNRPLKDTGDNVEETLNKISKSFADPSYSTRNPPDYFPRTIDIAPDVNSLEGKSNGSFTIALDVPAPMKGLVVNFDTTGTATPTTDYTLSAGKNITAVTANTFTIAPGVTTATLNFVSVADQVSEPNETVTVNLKPGNYKISNPSATQEIIEGDVGIAINPGSNALESKSNGAFTITLNTRTPASGLVVNFDTTGTATPTTDYTLSAGTNITAVTANTFTIAPGVTTATLNVVPVLDKFEQPNETVTVNLKPGGDYKISGASATVTIVEAIPPIVKQSYPADNANGVGLNDNLFINFSEEIQKGTGNILIKKASDNSTVKNINVADVSIGHPNTSVALGKVSNLVEQTEYYVEIPYGAFKTLAGNNFEGITESSAWNFKTGDITPPTIKSFSTTNNANEVEFSLKLFINFSEEIQSTGQPVVLRKASNNSEIPIALVPDINGSTATIVPKFLEEETEYYIEISPRSFKDLAGNYFEPITGSST